MVKKNKIPIWVWIILVVLCLIILLLLFVMNQSVELNREAINTPGEKRCVDQCGLNLEICVHSVRVLNEDRDCQNEFESCVDNCDY